MKIRNKLMVAFLGIVVLGGASVGGVAIKQELDNAKVLATQEAEHVAQVIAHSITHKSGSVDVAVYEDLESLQEYVDDFHQQQSRDFEVVDINQEIIADINPKNLGLTLDYDTQDEVGQTVKDGVTRTFVETSSTYPEGIQQLVVPLKTEGGKTVGAVILEYTPLYQEMLATAHETNRLIVLVTLGCIGSAALLSHLISSSIATPIKTLKKAALAIAQNNIDARVDIRSRDEVGDLATSFNQMAEDLQRSRRELENHAAQLTVTNQQLQQEIIDHQNTEKEFHQTLINLQQTQTQLIHTEKMSSLGQLVAGVSHEINNPVNFVHGNLKYVHEYTRNLLKLIDLYQDTYPTNTPEIRSLKQEIELEYVVEDLPKILTSMKMGTDRIRQLVTTLRTFSRLDEAEMKPVNIHEGIDSSCRILQYRLKAESGRSTIHLIKNYGNLPEIECYAGQLNQVFMNILSNAIDAFQHDNQDDCKSVLNGFDKCLNGSSNSSSSSSSNGSNKITISTQLVDVNWVSICIQDNGHGMTSRIREQIFNPFFTTKRIGEGTGLGLSISYQIVVAKHGGTLECVSEPGYGTEFWIKIPIRQILAAPKVHPEYRSDRLSSPITRPR